MRVLVVDGENDTLYLVRDILAADHHLFVCRTLSEIRGPANFDIALIDFFNPLCSFEMAEQFCWQNEIKVIAMSAMPTRVYPRQLNKPFDGPDLRRVIELCESEVDEFLVDTIETRYLKS